MQCNAGENACKGHEDVDLGSDGGFMILADSNIEKEMRVHFERLVRWYGRQELIHVYIENNIFHLYFSKEVKSIANNSQQSKKRIRER